MNIHVKYFASLREKAGKNEETLITHARTALDLYQELKVFYQFTLQPDHLKVAINDEFKPLETIIKDQDTVVFIPPVAGG